jgi:hypothetical protein
MNYQFEENNPGQCWYWINGDHDTMIVSWIDVPFVIFFSSIREHLFQLILSAVDSSITFQYAVQQGLA